MGERGRGLGGLDQRGPEVHSGDGDAEPIGHRLELPERGLEILAGLGRAPRLAPGNPPGQAGGGESRPVSDGELDGDRLLEVPFGRVESPGLHLAEGEVVQRRGDPLPIADEPVDLERLLELPDLLPAVAGHAVDDADVDEAGGDAETVADRALDLERPLLRLDRQGGAPGVEERRPEIGEGPGLPPRIRGLVEERRRAPEKRLGLREAPLPVGDVAQQIRRAGAGRRLAAGRGGRHRGLPLAAGLVEVPAQEGEAAEGVLAVADPATGLPRPIERLPEVLLRFGPAAENAPDLPPTETGLKDPAVEPPRLDAVRRGGVEGGGCPPQRRRRAAGLAGELSGSVERRPVELLRPRRGRRRAGRRRPRRAGSRRRRGGRRRDRSAGPAPRSAPRAAPGRSPRWRARRAGASAAPSA